MVIWKSKNPRCLKHFDKNALPVTFYSQKKSWMTGEIMESILIAVCATASASFYYSWIMQAVIQSINFEIHIKIYLQILLQRFNHWTLESYKILHGLELMERLSRNALGKQVYSIMT